MDFNKKIDARPGDQPAITGPKSLRDAKIWKDSSAGLKRLWKDYKTTLLVAFRNMTRADQEELITRICMIVTMGVSALLLMFFYSFLPLPLRVLSLPVTIVGAYWAGTKLVAPVIIVRYSQYLNQEFSS